MKLTISMRLDTLEMYSGDDRKAGISWTIDAVEFNDIMIAARNSDNMALSRMGYEMELMLNRLSELIKTELLKLSHREEQESFMIRTKDGLYTFKRVK